MPRALPYFQAAGGVAALCVLDAAVKQLTLSHALLLVVFGRYVAGTIFAFAVWQWQGRPAFSRTMLAPHLARGVLIALTASLFFYAIHRLPLAEAITLSFITPLMIPPLAQLLIGEKMRGPVLAAAAIGFIGVLVTVQGAPAFDGERLPALAAILAASVTYALAAIVMRSRAGDGATRLTLSGSVIPLVLLAPFAIGETMPGLDAVPWFVVAGLFGNLGIQLLARAYAEVEVQVLGVLEFTALFWAALFGWLLFDEAVRPQVWLGAAIIAGACLMAARSGRKVDGILPAA